MDCCLELLKDGLKKLSGVVLGYLWENMVYMYKFKENLDLLKKALDELIAERNTVLVRVEAGMLKGGQQLPTVEAWLSQVQTIVTNTNQLIDEASSQDGSAQDGSSQGASAQGASSQDASSRNASAQDASAQGASAQGASSQDASSQDASSQGASSQGASSQDASSQGASSQDAFSQDASSQSASSQGASSQDASSVHQRLSTFGCWSFNCNLGEEVFRKLIEVKSLSGKNFKEVTEQAPPPVVEKRYCQQTFGLDITLENTWESLMKNRKLGIYGMGGIGKTTLLTLINNKFVDVKKDFDVVIWVKVTKDADDNGKIEVVIKKIQDTIGERLHLYDEIWSKCSQIKKASDIGRVLREMKPRFVLLLDDLWEEVDLEVIGIPLEGNEYKIVFTTRFVDVCGRMGANENVEVQWLAANDALDLFMQNATCRGTLNCDLLDIAKEIAAKCYGLPLALKVIGKTMASRTTVDQWRRALATLESYPSEWNVVTDIFQVLKLSFDYLENKGAKLCFQYCALFPKAYYIKRDELVEYWIGEGILSERGGRQRAISRGYDIIDTLVEASLLYKDGDSGKKVHMHDMIREMALWIVSTSKDGEKYVVQAGAGISELPNFSDWTTVTKISLMNNQIEGITDDPKLPHPDLLKTLFLQNNKLVDIVGRFFKDLSTLVVLDISCNLGITELPEISMLVALRYLSLLETRIKDLPQGLGKLINLIHLDLESTPNLGSISLISGLIKLQVIRFYGSAAALDISLLEKLESLKDLERLTVTVREIKVLEEFLRCKRLAERTQGLYLVELQVSFAEIFGALDSLCSLGIINCLIIESDTEWEVKIRHQSPTPSNQRSPSNTWFENLSVVALSLCEGVRDLTWLIYAANLESLSITLSPNLEELISETKAVGVRVEPFQKLQVLRLEYLDALKSIYWSPLSFLMLHRVNIKNCPNLHKLPLNSTSVGRIDDLLIEVDDRWFEEAEWESKAIEERFRSVIRTVYTV
ncbi:P-loop containing nucleoside triphosphate hydrolase [Arabidopsis thaliana x Arabidopsis arenosa]|uniref:P-loop containing nucleoside triphosphate hydrolase n=1 Tax=Arabidopsis thaliana x Arabidopsis arenosa TaxID=1240361 RepID=A0A8T1XIG3_9BRAS|nr:P-loop containing nucleoside triphosphate hydrolase [Arabidopsis thaliana x Arabidopsis arenosa]